MAGPCQGPRRCSRLHHWSPDRLDRWRVQQLLVLEFRLDMGKRVHRRRHRGCISRNARPGLLQGYLGEPGLVASFLCGKSSCGGRHGIKVVRWSEGHLRAEWNRSHRTWSTIPAYYLRLVVGRPLAGVSTREVSRYAGRDPAVELRSVHVV